MSDTPSDLAPSALAFRVAVFSGVLGAMGWLPSEAHWFAGIVLLIAAAALLYEVLTRRLARRSNLFWLALSLAGAGVLLSGLLSFLATSLLVLAAVSGALGMVATLGDPGSEPSE